MLQVLSQVNVALAWRHQAADWEPIVGFHSAGYCTGRLSYVDCGACVAWEPVDVDADADAGRGVELVGLGH